MKYGGAFMYGKSKGISVALLWKNRRYHNQDNRDSNWTPLEYKS
jgi:hypothetical protein